MNISLEDPFCWFAGCLPGSVGSQSSTVLCNEYGEEYIITKNVFKKNMSAIGMGVYMHKVTVMIYTFIFVTNRPFHRQFHLSMFHHSMRWLLQVKVDITVLQQVG